MERERALIGGTMTGQARAHLLLPSLIFPFCRFLKSAMTERLCTYDEVNHDLRGKPTPEYIELYEQWGKGAIGIIVLGEIPPSSSGGRCRELTF